MSDAQEGLVGERTDGSDAAGEPIADLPAQRSVVESVTVYEGRIWDVVRDRVHLGEPEPLVREYVRHPGAVAILALDDEDRVLMIRQYRHPVREEMWELPAGLLDVPGEDQLVAAARELAEETDLVAGSWWRLVDLANSPGGSDENLRVYLARDLSPVADGDRHTREAEERDIVIRWVPLDEAVEAVLSGRLRNASAVTGLLAAAAARAGGWSALRESPAHPQ